jgi:hypothetical protein
VPVHHKSLQSIALTRFDRNAPLRMCPPCALESDGLVLSFDHRRARDTLAASHHAQPSSFKANPECQILVM